MALTNEELRQQLQDAFLEIAFRANRLREWVDLNRDLDSLKRSFEDFNGEVTRTVRALNNGGAVDAAQIVERWSRCADTDLLDLENACANFQYINRMARVEPSALAAPADAAQLIKVSLDALFELKKKIQNDLDDAAYKNLQQRCLLFDQTLKREVSRYKQSVKLELTNLCEMTVQVRMQI